jgi:RNA polymerase-binding protein DksA
MNQQAIKTQLQSRRGELLARLQKLHPHVHHRDEPLSADFGDQAIELENLDVLFELDEATRHELQQINNALERLQEGSYEHCVICGKPIGTARLRVLPYTDTCIDCAQRR